MDVIQLFKLFAIRLYDVINSGVRLPRQFGGLSISLLPMQTNIIKPRVCKNANIITAGVI